MEAKSVSEIPDEGGEWQYEPKWDGFRCLAFKNGSEVHLQSKSGQPLERYFPELVERLQRVKAPDFVVDGEIVVPGPGGALSFDSLLQRIHPAASRVRKLSAETPAIYIVFDIVVAPGGKNISSLPLSGRRAELEKFFEKMLKPIGGFQLSDAATDVATARKWFRGAGRSTDGIMAKRLHAAYDSGHRDAMVKIKPIRTADCVVGGFRYGSKEKVVGSLLLGLYDEAGLLNHVGFCSGLTAKMRQELTPKLQGLIEAPGFTGSAPGGPSRWTTERSTQWEPLRPELVVEVDWDHFTNGRFRHGTKFVRWRPDKAPAQCTMEQIHQALGRIK